MAGLSDNGTVRFCEIKLLATCYSSFLTILKISQLFACTLDLLATESASFNPDPYSILHKNFDDAVGGSYQMFVEGVETSEPHHVYRLPRLLMACEARILGLECSIGPLQDFPVETRLMHGTFVDKTIQDG